MRAVEPPRNVAVGDPHHTVTAIGLAAAQGEAARCIHCGFCLPACPTYQVLGLEKHSPRGRIQLVKAWAEGRVDADEGLIEALDLCLGCRACETACPVDVRYGVILEAARDELAQRRAGQPANILLKLALRHVAAYPRRLGLAARLAARFLHSAASQQLEMLAARRPGSWLAAALTFARALPSPRGRLEAARPSSSGGRLPGSAAAPGTTAPGRNRPRAALFAGCAQAGLFPQVNAATASLLAAAGFQLEVPAGQVCCGALHRHHGDPEHARALLRRNLQAFGLLRGEPAEVIVFNAGGCLAWIKEAASLFPAGTPEHAAARQLGVLAKDVAEVLVERGWTPGDAVQGGQRRSLRVVYQPSCHLTHVCGVTDAPLRLLRSLPGVTVALPSDGGTCCGSAGIYNALHPQVSAAVLERKMAAIAALGGGPPDVIVTSNPGCHLQMLAGVRQAGLAGQVAVMQLPEFIAWYLARPRGPLPPAA